MIIKNRKQFLVLLINLLYFSLPVFSQHDWGLWDGDEDRGRYFVLGDLNEDGVADSVVVVYNSDVNNDLTITIYLKNKSTFTYDYGRESKLLLEGELITAKFLISDGYLIYQTHDYLDTYLEQYFFKYYPDQDDCFLYLQYFIKDEYDEGAIIPTMIFAGPRSRCLEVNTFESEKIELVTIVSLEKQAEAWNKLKYTHQSCLSEYKSKKYITTLSVTKDDIYNYLSSIEICDSTITIFNDLAFFIVNQSIENGELSDRLNAAVIILESILYYFPERTVAYINLGDAYWELNEYDKAKQSKLIVLTLIR